MTSGWGERNQMYLGSPDSAFHVAFLSSPISEMCCSVSLLAMHLLVSSSPELTSMHHGIHRRSSQLTSVDAAARPCYATNAPDIQRTARLNGGLRGPTSDYRPRGSTEQASYFDNVAVTATGGGMDGQKAGCSVLLLSTS